VRQCHKEDLRSRLGRHGAWIWHAAHGDDQRPVEPRHERKSYGREDTFEKDLTDLVVIERKLRELTESVCRRMEKKSETGKTITLKIKYHNFETITRSKTIKLPMRDGETIFKTAVELMRSKTEAGQRPIRLIGVSVAK
jgi:DNA polymerase-4